MQVADHTYNGNKRCCPHGGGTAPGHLPAQATMKDVGLPLIASAARCRERGPVWKGAVRVVCLGGSRARPASPGGRNPPTFALRSAGDRAVAAPSSRVLGDGVPQVATVDVWPEAGGEEQFGVRGVPREEVGRALLGTGPPQQVHVG